MYGKIITTISIIHIMPGTSFSEHVLVILSTLDQCSHDLSILKIPENLLLHDSLSFQVVELWSQKNVFTGLNGHEGS